MLAGSAQAFAAHSITPIIPNLSNFLTYLPAIHVRYEGSNFRGYSYQIGGSFFLLSSSQMEVRRTEIPVFLPSVCVSYFGLNGSLKVLQETAGEVPKNLFRTSLETWRRWPQGGGYNSKALFHGEVQSTTFDVGGRFVVTPRQPRKLRLETTFRVERLGDASLIQIRPEACPNFKIAQYDLSPSSLGLIQFPVFGLPLPRASRRNSSALALFTFKVPGSAAPSGTSTQRPPV